MAEIPQEIVLKRNRDLEGRDWEIWLRRGLFTLLPIAGLLGLLNLFGQRPQTTLANAAGAASLEVYAPSRVRGGLIYMARFHITAQRDLGHATVVLSPGWLESQTLNTIEPSPVNEASDNGRLSFDVGHVPAGQSYILFMEFQVNPTNVGHRDASVTLKDGQQTLLRIHRTITIFP